MEIEVNMLSILLAGISYMLVGFIWYSPAVFGKPWMKLMGYTEKSMKAAQKKMGPYYALSFVASLVSAFVINHVAVMSSQVFSYPFGTALLSTAFWMWFGFVAPVQMTRVIYGKDSWNLFYINTGYQLVAMMAMAFVIGLI